MKIKWYGHACFQAVSESGVRVVMDPYTPATSGYMPVPHEADVVIISSDNDSFHCRADLVPGNPQVVNALKVAQAGGRIQTHGIEIRAIEAMEALHHREHDPDQNGMYRFEMDGIHVGHMGDMGNALTPGQLDFFAGIDVLLALTGGHPTIELPDLQILINAVRPKLVIPMHFRTLRYRPRNCYWIATFLELFGDSDVDFACDSQVELTRAQLPAETRVLVLTHAC